MIKTIFSLFHFLLLILMCITFIPNNAIAEKLLVKDGKRYICVAFDQGYCITCSGKKILVEEGSITETNKTCKPPIKSPDNNDKSIEQKGDP
jgi:hypothetical protein